MRKFFLIMILLAGILALTFPALAQDSTARFDSTRCTFAVPDGTDPECGFLVVPEDWSNPTSGTIRLAVAVFHSKNQNAQSAPVIYLDGGPGGNTLESVQFSFSSLFEPFLKDHDVIVFDQRGVGLSQPSLDCPESTTLTYETLDQHLSVDEDIQLYTQAIESCGARLERQGVNLAVYNSAASAADVNDLRQVLGYEQLNLFGISYGTRLALTIMRDFPTTIRSAIIDSVVPLQSSGFNPGQSADRAFNELFKACAAEAACNTQYPNLKTVFYDTVNRLNVSPVTLSIPNPQVGGTLDAVVDGNDYVGLVFQSMYISSLIEQLPEAMYEASRGDLSFFKNVLLLQLLQLGLISDGMYYAVQCNEEYPFDTAASIQANLDSLPEGLRGFAREGLIDPAALELCQTLGTRTPDPIENLPVVSDIPTLVMSGQFDPITPPAYGKEAAATLSNSYFFEFPGLTHGVVPADRCPLNIALAFLDNPAVSPDSSCISLMSPSIFVLTGDNAVDSVDINLVGYTNSEQGFSSVHPESWTLLYQSTYIRGDDAGDQTAVSQLVFLVPTVEQTLSILASQLGWDELPVSTGTREANGLKWIIYQFDYFGYPSDMALAQGKDKTFVIQLVSHENEHQAMYEAVFLPAVDSFVPID